MDLQFYQESTARTTIYSKEYAITYPLLGLAGEVGELANKYKKVLRDNHGIMSEEARKALADEAGDVLWYLTRFVADLGLSLNQVALDNLLKLEKRKEAGTLQGSGDNR